MTIIGDKNTFAVEYRIKMYDQIKMAYSRIWIQGRYFGDIEDTGLLFSISNCLKIIINRSDIFEPEFLNKTDEEIIGLTFATELLNVSFFDLEAKEQDRLVSYGKHYFHFGENYDCFLISVFKNEDQIHFVWKLHVSDNRYFVGYSRNAQHGVVKLADIELVYEQLQKEFVSK